MKYIIIIISMLFYSNLTIACDFFNEKFTENSNKLMGKKSLFYDAYKQGKCVLEEALKPLPEEQREIIANLIAKAYKTEN